MLDDEHGRVLAGERAHHSRHEFELFLGADSARRFVQHQNARPAHEGHRYVQQLSRTLRQLVRGTVAIRHQAEPTQQLVGALDQARLAHVVQQRPAGIAADGKRDEQVLENLHALKDLADLE